jgi:hypothetical protein
MRIQEAKDFLVQQAAEQAALESVSFSGLEKRMMYFTESEERLEDPAKLNEEFEAAYDTDEFESKTSSLLHNAYRRLKKENVDSVRKWHDAIRVLRKGDHYLLVLWDLGPQERPPYDSLKLFGTAILLIVALLGVIFLVDHLNIHWSPGPSTHRSIPAWIQRSVLLVGLAVYVYYGVLPLFLKRPLPSLINGVAKFLGPLLKKRGT